MTTFADDGSVRIGDAMLDYPMDNTPVPHVRRGSWVYERGEWVLRRDDADAARVKVSQVRLGGTVEDFRPFGMSRVLPL